MKRADVFDILTDFASEQHGLFTRAQANSAGISDQALEKHLRAGDVHRVARGTYRFRRDLPDQHEEIWAAWLQLAPDLTAYERVHRSDPPDAVASHITAAQIYDLGVLFPERHEFTVSTLRRTRRPDVRLYRAAVPKTDWELAHGLPVTRPPRIVVDLLRRHRDIDHVAHIASDAVERHLTSRAELVSHLASFTSDQPTRARDTAALLDLLPAESATSSETEIGK